MSRGPPVGEPELSRHVPRAHSPDPLANPEPFQHPQAVRRQRHARADLGQLLRLLMHLDLDPGPRQPKCHCHPAEAAADHHRPQHYVLPPSRTARPQIQANPAPVRLAVRSQGRGAECHDLHRSGARAVFTMHTYAATSPPYDPKLLPALDSVRGMRVSQTRPHLRPIDLIKELRNGAI